MRSNHSHLTGLVIILKNWLPLIGTAAVLIGFQVVSQLQPSIGEMLQWSRADLAQGQWWRLLTGQWVHLGVTHLLLNLAGLGLLAALFDRPIPVAWWAGYLLAAPVAISLGLLWFIPGLDWYRGFSGCLHGLFVMLALANLPRHPRWNALLLTGLAVKLGAEAFFPMGTADLIGAAVIYQAHCLGALTGLIAGVMLLVTRRWRIRETPKPPSPE